jgi:hypothetical protein
LRINRYFNYNITPFRREIMSVHKKLVKISAADIQDSEELQEILRSAHRARAAEDITQIAAAGLAPILNPLIFNERTNRRLEELGLEAARQSAGQNFLGNLGTFGAAALGAGVAGAPGGLLGALAGTLIRQRTFKDRIREAYAANQLTG